MIVLPGDTGVTSPVDALTVATPALLLLHEPPLFPFAFKSRVELIHTAEPPLIVPALTTGLTVIGAD